jgi:predicted nucleotide-binding protein (sugar kinase/HSP70/actin superfamily)
VVENMARTLWSQVDLPPNCVVLLHGQTMLSDPLPLAITHRLQSFLGQPAYALVPPYPGHRACLGLIRAALQASVDGVETIALRDFVTARFEKRLVQCKGAACDDANAVCNRTALKCQGADGRQFSFTLGGCSAINELFARSKSRHGETRANAGSDSYKEIWDFIEARQPHSDDPRRLVIPRSFVIADWSYFLSQIFTQLGVPVHVDSVQESDLRLGQSLLNIDTCAPQIGAVGQFRRLAGEPHGVILAPQIERICTAGTSVGRTCTTNQGGVVVAKTLAEIARPDARFHLFSFSLERLDPEFVVDQIFDRLQPVFRAYDLAVDRRTLLAVVERAFERHHQLRREAADFAADLIERALAEERQVALVIGRQYVLNPGVYDSHVRRLLRDKRMTAIPSYVLDVELDDAYGGIYWRNSHFIVTVINAVANRTLHQRLSHPRLRALFQRLEQGDRLLPVVQISTFLCGPDSVTRHLVAEIMKSRPFLLIQSDAILKELAHLENRVNTYVRQLELGIHARVHAGAKAFDVRFLDSLDHRDRLDRDTDVLYFPTISDNRPLTSVLRGAGFTCIDNYRDGDDLHGRVKHGRKFAGDAVCAPLAAVYADLERAVEDFAERKAGDPSFRGKKRLLYADNTGSGPCRQGQYVGVHKLLAHRHMNGACRPDGFVKFLIADEERGYNFGLEEWTLLRVYQAAILQGVLHQMLFASAAECRDVEQYEKLLAEYRALKETLYRRLERFTGPGRWARALVGAAERVPWLGAVAKYFAYRLHGWDLQEPLRRFAAHWQTHAPGGERLEIQVSGEAYMRVALGEQIFRTLLAQLGFRRFRLELTPLWSYVEYLIEDAMETHRDRLHVARACAARVGTANGANASTIRSARRALRRLGRLRWMLRAVLARPLYRAAGLPLPEPVAEQMTAARAVIPTLRPVGELAPFVGEALNAVRRQTDIFLNVAPSGCMVSSMGAAMSPRLNQERAGEPGCIQALFSADGELDEDMLRLALLKSLGPRKFFLRPGIS